MNYPGKRKKKKILLILVCISTAPQRKFLEFSFQLTFDLSFQADLLWLLHQEFRAQDCALMCIKLFPFHFLGRFFLEQFIR